MPEITALCSLSWKANKKDGRIDVTHSLKKRLATHTCAGWGLHPQKEEVTKEQSGQVLKVSPRTGEDW